ncbi:SMI1/KNR4 family protein [Streptomyces sp. NPDC055078]
MDAIDWEEISASWGTALPADYRQFMEVYGPGGIDDFLNILEPEPWYEHQAGQGITPETKTARLTWRMERGTFDVTNAPRLISWGVDAVADLLCWDASGDNPDEWPVVVWGRSFGKWSWYDFGMVEFLCRLFQADFDEPPLGGTSLWGVSGARYLRLAEERRLWAQGFDDPWDQV